jgi:hypothetical protein
MARNSKPKIRLKEKADRRIEVFPTTIQLVFALVVALGILLFLLYTDWSQLKKESAEAVAPKEVKASYFATGRVPDLTKYESNIVRPLIYESSIRRLRESDIVRLKLARASENMNTSRLVEIYPTLTDEEKRYMRDSLSDWKISRLLVKLPVLDAQNLLSALYADMKELETKESPANVDSSSVEPTATGGSATGNNTAGAATPELAAGASAPVSGIQPANDSTATPVDTGAAVASDGIQDTSGTTDNAGGAQGP